MKASSKILPAAGILAALLVLKAVTSTWYGGYDARFYRAQAVDPFSSAAAARTAPYCWRILPAVRKCSRASSTRHWSIRFQA